MYRILITCVMLSAYIRLGPEVVWYAYTAVYSIFMLVPKSFWFGMVWYEGMGQRVYIFS